MVGDEEILLVNIEGSYHAINDTRQPLISWS